MWTPLREEIGKIGRDFNLTDKIVPVGLSEWRSIENKVYDTFYGIPHNYSRPVWIWENLKVESIGINPEKHAYLLLDKIIDKDEQLFLLLNETVNEADKFWIYESTVQPIQTVMSEASEIDEITIVDKKFSWILCINHHNTIIGGGDKVIKKLRLVQAP
ncbi:MAG: hypothetical protein KF803_15125 [Cyclobacteriaceae bacterium]|nr:hypothetical protein [Cyclobacteriaceae bacterium]